MHGYLYFFAINLLGFLLALWYGCKTTQWRWREYFMTAIWPVVGVVVLAYFEGVKIIIYFFLSAFIGFLLEVALDILLEKIMGEKLYQYKRLSVKGYSSLLILPFWGAAGIVFLAISKFLGLL